MACKICHFNIIKIFLQKFIRESITINSTLTISTSTFTAQHTDKDAPNSILKVGMTSRTYCAAISSEPRRTTTKNLRFQVLTAASMNKGFWDIPPCSLGVDRRFRGAYCFHYQGYESPMKLGEPQSRS
jgi:hypothetical protein